MKRLEIITKGIIKENPVFVMLLGTCPSLAVTTSIKGALGMGAAAMFVLVMSNIIISLIRNFVDEGIRIPCYIVVIASFVAVCEMLLSAYVPSLYKMLGIYLSLIAVNCMILARAEAFASKNTVFSAVLDSIGMGLGFIFALLVMAFIRELIGQGSLLGYSIPIIGNYTVPIMTESPGGFFTFAFVIAIVNKIGRLKPDKNIGESCSGCRRCG